MYIDFKESGRMNNISVDNKEGFVFVSDEVIINGNVVYKNNDETLSVYKNVNITRIDLIKEIDILLKQCEKYLSLDFQQSLGLTSEDIQDIDQYYSTINSILNYFDNIDNIEDKERFKIVIYTNKDKVFTNENNLYYLLKPIFIK